MPLDPLLDTSTRTSSLPFSDLRQIKLQLAFLTLHDTWITLYPRDRDYTFFSPPHNRYVKIDYLFIAQSDLSYLHGASIKSIVLSDHHPITQILVFSVIIPSTKLWRLDTSLFMDSGDSAILRQELTDFFLHNNIPDVSPMTKWKAHKCVISGQLLSISAQRKREHQALILSQRGEYVPVC